MTLLQQNVMLFSELNKLKLVSIPTFSLITRFLKISLFFGEKCCQLVSYLVAISTVQFLGGGEVAGCVCQSAGALNRRNVDSFETFAQFLFVLKKPTAACKALSRTNIAKTVLLFNKVIFGYFDNIFGSSKGHL